MRHGVCRPFALIAGVVAAGASRPAVFQRSRRGDLLLGRHTGLLVTGFPLMPFDLLTALIFLLVSLTSHSLKMLRKGAKSLSPCALSTPSLMAMKRTPFCGKIISLIWTRPQKIYAELLTTNSNMPWSKKQSALLLLIAFLLFKVLIAIYRSYIVYFLLHLCADM